MPASTAASPSGAANAILASLYINAGVFTKDHGINATGYNSCAGITVTGGERLPGRDRCGGRA